MPVSGGWFKMLAELHASLALSEEERGNNTAVLVRGSKACFRKNIWFSLL